MSVLKRAADRGVTVAWSPLEEKEGSHRRGIQGGRRGGFDDYGGELELFSFDVSDSANVDGGLAKLGGAKTSVKFESLAWTKYAGSSGQFPLGVVAGGMADGTVKIWDPQKVIQQQDAPSGGGLLGSSSKHSSNVNSVQFCPHAAGGQLASGGADNEVFIHDLGRPDQPSVYAPSEAGPESMMPPSAPWHGTSRSCTSWRARRGTGRASFGTCGRRGPGAS